MKRFHHFAAEKFYNLASPTAVNASTIWMIIDLFEFSVKEMMQSLLKGTTSAAFVAAVVFTDLLNFGFNFLVVFV